LAGDPLSLRRLAINLDHDHPQYGLHITDYGDSVRNIKTIEQAAEQGVGAIKNVSPHGPYILVGYSFGGHLAIETARQLAVSGEKEPLVVLIDTYPPIPLRSTTPVKRVRIHYNNLRKLKSAREVAKYFSDRFVLMYLRLFRYEPARAIAKQLSAPAKGTGSTARIALAAYKPKPYPGKVVLFKAKERKLYLDWDPMEPWNEFISGEMEIRILPGEHNNLIKNPFAIEVARQLQEVVANWTEIHSENL